MTTGTDGRPQFSLEFENGGQPLMQDVLERFFAAESNVYLILQLKSGAGDTERAV